MTEPEVSPLAVELLWRENPEHVRRHAIEAGNEIIERLNSFASARWRAVTAAERWLLTHSPMDVVVDIESFKRSHSFSESVARERMFQRDILALHTNFVPLVRGNIDADKRRGDPLIIARPGLRIPEWWQDRYEIIYGSNIPWMLSAILQGVFLGSPEIGETRAWRSP